MVHGASCVSVCLCVRKVGVTSEYQKWGLVGRRSGVTTLMEGELVVGGIPSLHCVRWLSIPVNCFVHQCIEFTVWLLVCRGPDREWPLKGTQRRTAGQQGKLHALCASALKAEISTYLCRSLCHFLADKPIHSSP